MMNRRSEQKRRWFFSVIMAVVLLMLICGGVSMASSGGEHGGSAKKGWVATDTYRVMNFSVLAIALFFILRKPMSQALDSRIKGIKDQLSDLEAKKEEAEKQLAQYNQKLSLLDKESEKIVSEYIRQGNEAKERILKEAESAAEKLEEQAKKNIEHEFKQAKERLQEEILEKALAKAEGMVKNSITSDDQDRLVDEYLEKVVA